MRTPRTRLTLPRPFVKTRIMWRSLGRTFPVLAIIGVLAVAVRVQTISQPFIDSWSWRQSDVAAIARNYLQGGFRFSWPRIDWAGDAPGYVGTEFPILPFMAALCYGLTGVHEWIGRVQSLVFFGLSLPFFFALIRETFGEIEGRWATLFYSFAPLTVMTSRCFMPDMPSLSLSIIGLYYFMQWLRTDNWPAFAIAAAATSLAVLIKLPSAVIGAPMACAALERLGLRGLRRLALWAFGVIVLAPAIIWYWHAIDIAQRFYPYHFFGEGGIRLMSASWYLDILRRTLNPGLTVSFSVLAAVGALVAIRKRKSALVYWWLAAMLAFVLVVGYGNRHPWYQLPLVPIAAAFAGCAMVKVTTQLESWPAAKFGFVALVIVVFGSESHRAAKTFNRPAAADLRELGLALKNTTPPGALIVVADYGDPTALYYAERKGWHFLETHGVYNGHPTTSADAITDLKQLRAQGAQYIAFYSGTMWWLDYYSELGQYLADSSEVIDSTPAYRIFKLQP